MKDKPKNNQPINDMISDINNEITYLTNLSYELCSRLMIVKNEIEEIRSSL